MTTPHRQDDGLRLSSKELEDFHDLLRQCGYNFDEVHPECYRNFSYVKLANILRACATPASRDGAEGMGDPLADLVSRFSKALLAKLKLAQANGRSGWERDDWEADCQRGLYVEKGDPRDVAAFCAFLWHHGWITTPPKPAPDALREALETIKRTTFSGSEMGDEYIRGNRDAHATCAAMAKRALSPAPVPPADGRFSKLTNSEAAHIPDGATLHVSNKTTRELRSAALAPLPAVAAEADGKFWCQTCSGTGRAPPSENLVSPPLMGEREAIARTNLIRDSIQRVYDEMCVQFSGVHSDDRTDSWLLNLHHSLTLLSLQSGAGEGGDR